MTTGTDYYHGLKGLYFNELLRTLVDVGNLNNRRVLDFGCGVQALRGFLTHKDYVGYDIDPTLTDVATLDGVAYDIMVANEVFYEMNESDLIETLEKIAPPLLLVGISRQSILNKIGAALLHPGAHDATRIMPKRELEILRRYYRINAHRSVWFLADVYLLEKI